MMRLLKRIDDWLIVSETRQTVILGVLFAAALFAYSALK